MCATMLKTLEPLTPNPSPSPSPNPNPNQAAVQPIVGATSEDLTLTLTLSLIPA